MLPVLFNSNIFRIYTFGAFLVLAFFWGSFLLWKNIRLSSYKEEDIFDGVFWALFGALFVSRVAYVALHFDKFGVDIWKFILINGYPGLSLYGFIIGGVGTLSLYLRSKKMKFRDSTNYFVSPALLALCIGSLGNFFSRIYIPILVESLLYGVEAYISYRIFFAYRRQKYPQLFNLAFFCWSLSLTKLISSVLMRTELIIPGVLLLTFSLYFLYYFRSLVFKNFTLHKRLLRKKHAHIQTHPPRTED